MTDPAPVVHVPGHVVACHRADEAPALRAEAARFETWAEAV